MELVSLVYLISLALYMVVILQSIHIRKLNHRNIILEKQYKDKTDREKLSLIIEIYKNIDFNNVNQDENKLWVDWVNRTFIKYKDTNR